MSNSYDPLNGSTVVTSYAHNRVHAGRLAVVSDYDSDVDIASPKKWLFKDANTGAGTNIDFYVAVSGAGLIELYENPDISDNGTALTSQHFNRNSSSSLAYMLPYKDPVTNSDGTLIFQEYIPGGVGPAATRLGASSRPTAEWILKVNEDYILKFTAAADNTLISMNASFYDSGKVLP